MFICGRSNLGQEECYMSAWGRSNLGQEEGLQDHGPADPTSGSGVCAFLRHRIAG